MRMRIVVGLLGGALLLALVGCAEPGPQGPTGPVGPAGPAGQQGPSGAPGAPVAAAATASAYSGEMYDDCRDSTAYLRPAAMRVMLETQGDVPGLKDMNNDDIRALFIIGCFLIASGADHPWGGLLATAGDARS